MILREREFRHARRNEWYALTLEFAKRYREYYIVFYVWADGKIKRYTTVWDKKEAAHGEYARRLRGCRKAYKEVNRGV